MCQFRVSGFLGFEEEHEKAGDAGSLEVGRLEHDSQKNPNAKARNIIQGLSN